MKSGNSDCEQCRIPRNKDEAGIEKINAPNIRYNIFVCFINNSLYIHSFVLDGADKGPEHRCGILT